MATRYSAVQAARQLVVEQEKTPINWGEVLGQMERQYRRGIDRRVREAKEALK